MAEVIKIIEFKPVVEPACFVAAPGEFGRWGLCATFMSICRQESQPIDRCNQCLFGYQNPYWLAGMVHRKLASTSG
jgi:hypothetical protein